MAPDAWLVAWDSDGVSCRRAFTEEAEARHWADRMADTEGCSGVAVFALSVVKECLTADDDQPEPDEDPNNTFRGDFAGFAENH